MCRNWIGQPCADSLICRRAIRRTPGALVVSEVSQCHVYAYDWSNHVNLTTDEWESPTWTCAGERKSRDSERKSRSFYGNGSRGRSTKAVREENEVVCDVVAVADIATRGGLSLVAGTGVCRRGISSLVALACVATWRFLIGPEIFYR
ncbi:hypothetical protein Syun_016775 [Stephania yunnanensis]|uniref:Uncharacterized protein n=1 Tax=Stephania yunnanensis TaxID=152371 RepID=A0AAP0J5U2_9MAGN